MPLLPVRARHIPLAVATLLLSVASPVLAADDTFQRTFTLNGAAMLELSNGSGNVQITRGSNDVVRVNARVRASGWSLIGSSADDRVRQVVSNPPLEQVGNTIRIGKKQHDWFRNVSIDYDITVPAQTQMNVDTGSGSLRIHGTSGGIVGNTGSGDVTLEDVHGNTKLETGSGSIRVHGLAGAANLHTGSGDIEANLTGPGDAKLETGSGSIRAHGLQGGLHADTGSGDIDIQGQPGSSWKLETGSGSIDLALGSGSRFSLDAETGSGSINVDQSITFQGSTDKHHLSGNVNGGGPTVRAQTGSGSIHIR